MKRALRPRLGAVLSLALALVLCGSEPSTGQTVVRINEYVGFMFEGGGFPPSDPGDQLVGVGRISSTFPPVAYSGSAELTWALSDLVSIGQVTLGSLLIIDYAPRGRLDIYEDSLTPADFGTNPTPGEAPGSFTDGSIYLTGMTSATRIVYNTDIGRGTFFTAVSFDGGSSFGDLGTSQGFTFSALIGPDAVNAPPIPDGYDLEATGATFAPCVVDNTVSGIVTAVPGTPLAGVTVNLYSVLTDGGQTQLPVLLDSRITSSDGSYLFDDLPLNTYYVEAMVPEGYSTTEGPHCPRDGKLHELQNEFRVPVGACTPSSITLNQYSKQSKFRGGATATFDGLGLVDVVCDDVVCPTGATMDGGDFVLTFDSYGWLKAGGFGSSTSFELDLGDCGRHKLEKLHTSCSRDVITAVPNQLQIGRGSMTVLGGCGDCLRSPDPSSCPTKDNLYRLDGEYRIPMDGCAPDAITFRVFKDKSDLKGTAAAIFSGGVLSSLQSDPVAFISGATMEGDELVVSFQASGYKDNGDFGQEASFELDLGACGTRKLLKLWTSCARPVFTDLPYALEGGRGSVIFRGGCGRCLVFPTEEERLGLSLEPSCGSNFVKNVGLFRSMAKHDRKGYGFWKDSFNKREIPETILQGYLDEIQSRFVNKYQIFTFFDGATDLLEATAVLSMSGTDLDQAKRRFFAVVLNVVSGRLQTHELATKDGATVSQAITHVSSLINDGDPSNDERAEKIAEYINDGVLLASGYVPTTIAQIAYKQLPDAGQPDGSLLFPNQPNPFNPSTRISFSLPTRGDVKLTIHDVAGRRVTTLINRNLSAGTHRIEWDGRNAAGRPVASGVYVYRLDTESTSEQRKMVLLK